jgi:hypothetical protein
MILTYFKEGPTFAEVVPSVAFQSIPEIVVQNLRTPLVEALIDEIYREEYGDPTINPLAEISQVNMNNVGDD